MYSKPLAKRRSAIVNVRDADPEHDVTKSRRRERSRRCVSILIN